MAANFWEQDKPAGGAGAGDAGPTGGGEWWKADKPAAQVDLPVDVAPSEAGAGRGRGGRTAADQPVRLAAVSQPQETRQRSIDESDPLTRITPSTSARDATFTATALREAGAGRGIAPDPRRLDAPPVPQSSGSIAKDVAINAFAGGAKTLAGTAATAAELAGAHDTAKSLDEVSRNWEGVQKENGGDTLPGKAANLVGAVAPALLLPATRAAQLVGNAGLFAIPAFRETLKSQLDQGRDFPLALAHAAKDFGVNLFLPTVATRGSTAVAKALGAGSAKGAAAAGTAAAQAAGEGAAFSAANSTLDKGIDTVAGEKNDRDWVDLQDMAAGALGFTALRAGHMVPKAASAVADRVGSNSQQFGRAFGQDVDAAHFDTSTPGVQLNPNLANAQPPAPTPPAGPAGGAGGAGGPAEPSPADKLLNIVSITDPQRIKELRAAGETAVADELQRRADTASAETELQGMAGQPFNGPEFEHFYRRLRAEGTKPAEASARAGMLGQFSQLGTQAGLSPKAIQAATEATLKMPLGKVPEFLDRYAASLARGGMGTALAERELANAVTATGDQAMHTALATLPVADKAPAKDTAPRETAAPQQGAQQPALDTGRDVQVTAEHDQVHTAATSPLSDRPEPTQAQKEAGNYAMGHLRIGGLDISVENPQGSVRRGVGADGKAWETPLNDHYGYIKGTVGADKDHVDVFVKPGTPADYRGPVFVVDQVEPSTGRFDEHKVVLGAADRAEAEQIYRRNYSADWQGMGAITELPMRAFQAWAASKHTKEPLGDLSHIQPVEPQPADRTAAAPAPDRAAAAKGEAPAVAAGGAGEGGKPAGGADHAPAADVAPPKEGKAQTETPANAGVSASGEHFPHVEQFDRVNVGPGGFIKPKAVAAGKHTYRETSVSGVDDRMREDRYAVPFGGFVADRQELALGQGENRGVQLVFRPDSVSGREHAKPMTGDLAGREYRTDLLAPHAVQAVTMWPADLKTARTLTRQRLAAEFDRENLPDGRVHFTRKGLDKVPAPEMEPITFVRNPSGTLAVRGDQATVRRVLEGAGITRLMTAKDGLLVGKTQAEAAEKSLAKLAPRKAAAEKSSNDQPLKMGVAPGSAEPVTVRDGVIHIGKYEALNFDTGEPIKAPESATSEDLKRLLKEAGAISARQRFFGGQGSAAPAPAETAAKRGWDLADGPPLTVPEVKAAVQEIVGRWENGPKVHVVLSARELPGQNSSDVRGLYTRDHGVWVVASLNRSRGALAKTLAHEAIAHHGLRSMLGKKDFDRLTENIQKGVEAGDKTLVALRDEVRSAYDFAHLSEGKARQSEADEIAAAAVEKAVSPDGEFRPGYGFMKAVYARIAEFLRGLGINVRFTAAELQGMLVLAQRHLKVGERTAGGGELVMAAARDDGPAQARAAPTPEAPAAEPAKEAKPAEPAKARKPYGGPGAELVKSTRDMVGKLVEDAVLKVTPMSGGSDAARAVAKDYANAERLARYKWTQFDDILKKNFTEAERKAMWEAADEQNVLMQGGKDTKGKGLDRLTPEQRKVMDTLHAYGESLLQRAKEVGMFKGEGLPYWTPRMAVMIDEKGEYHRPGEGQTATDEGRGFNVTKTSGNLKQRKYLTAAETEAAMKGKLGEGAQLVRDIRTMPLAMARLERAIAGRELINQIKEIGRTTGIDTTASRDGPNFFTVNHPAFKTMVANQVPVRLSEYFDRKLMDGLTQLADNLGVKHQRKGALKGGSLGLAYRNKPLVQTKFFTPDQVLTHEIGHQIDFKYGLADQLTKRGATAKELRALADLRIEGQEGEASDYFKAYLRKGTEKIANLVHAYVHNPERFRTVAPETFKWFDDFVNRTPELAPLKDLGPSLTIGSRQVEGKVTQWEERPLYVSRDFEGPLKAILAEQSGEMYKQMMNLKAKSMGLIMYSPLIHNAVEWGRALPIMPGKVLTFRVYFDGNKIKNDPMQMAQAIKDGMVPIGHRGNIQDITGLMEDPNLAPGRSWTAKLLGGAIGAVNAKAGTAVKKGVDAAGDFWHNTLLWDRVGDLQAGIYGQMRGDMIKKGMDEQTAGRLAAHFANRYAGALPNEAMSANARKIANFVLFSRSFTLGNLGVMKDVFTGFPPDVAAQIQRDAGEASLRAGRNVARRTAAAAFALDVALMYAGNALLQSALDKLKRDKSWDEITQGYVDRFHDLVHRLQEGPLDVLTSPLESLASLTPNSGNEPGKEDRIHYGTDESGTNIYVRSPVGKVGEEFKNWLSSPIDSLLRKQGTIMRPITQTLENDKGFGQRVYNPDDKSWPGLAKNLGRVVWNFMSQQVPADTLQAGVDWAHGQADDTDKLKVLGPLAGVTFSKGAPGGPEVGEMYHESKVHQGEVADVMPDVRHAIKVGDVDKAIDLMEGAKMTPGQIKAVLKHQQDPASRLSPQALKKYYGTASEESKARMEKYGR